MRTLIINEMIDYFVILFRLFMIKLVMQLMKSLIPVSFECTMQFSFAFSFSAVRSYSSEIGNTSIQELRAIKDKANQTISVLFLQNDEIINLQLQQLVWLQDFRFGDGRFGIFC